MSLSILATSFLAGCNSSDPPEEENTPQAKEKDPTANAASSPTAEFAGAGRGIAPWLRDNDKDGYRRFRDCNDNNASVYKWMWGYTDADADTYTVGAVVKSCTNGTLPAGYSAAQSAIEDCDDTDQSIFEEITGYEDVDGDSYTTGSGATFCTDGTLSSGYTETQSTTDDCDDSDPYAYQNLTGYTDADSDSYTVGSAQTFCTDDFLPEGNIDVQSATDDCDDTTSSIYPFATETPYDGIDQDCDGSDLTDVDGDGVSVTDDCDDTDGTVSQNVTGYVDVDGDAYTVGSAQTFCTDGTVPSGYTDLQSATDDCDDTNGTTYQNLTGYTDLDADGYTIGSAQSLCSGAALVAGYSATSAGDDCDDGDSASYQNLTGYTDLDADGYTVGSAQSLCSGAALVAGYSATSAGTDCDDGDSTCYQNVTAYVDADADNYTVGSAQTLCTDGSVTTGYNATQSATDDCDDATSGTNPGATEVCNDGIDNDCSNDGSPECRLSGTYDLTSEYDMRVRGTATDQANGFSVGTADINGDGFDDWLRGAPNLAYTSGGYAGLRMGSATGLGTTTTYLYGVTTGDLAGYSVSGAGDVDGDGVEDIITGAVNESTNATYSGAAYLVSGVDVTTGTLDALAIAITYGVEDNNYAGWSTSGAGDVDNDGYDDFLVGAYGYGYNGPWEGYGAVYLNYGPVSSDFDLSSSNVIITGASLTDATGLGLSGGDVDGDGYSDILMGSYLNQDNGVADGVYGAGRADVFYGPVSSGSYNINDSNVQIYGESGGDLLGARGTIKGDINNDGNNDIIVCATQESSVDDRNGACYLFLGSSTLSGALYAGTDSYTKWVGTEEGTNAGISVATGDLNGDEYDDVIIGANGGGGIEPSSTFIGGAYVFYSPQTAGTVSLANADAIFTGESQGDFAGSSVGTGDFNGDGKDDVMVGAPYTDYNAINGGSVYFVYGTGM